MSVADATPRCAKNAITPLGRTRIAQQLLRAADGSFKGDHLLREPLDHLQVEGFEISDSNG
jgi:predicted DsbA family dithiol-disulfide isomerase